MALSKLESHIIIRIAESSEKLSAYDFKDTAYYANVHKACNKLVESGILDYDLEKNEKGATKKVFRLTSFGFCKFVVESDLFFGAKKFSELKNAIGYPADRLVRLDLFLQRWSHLHEAIGCFYELFLKKKEDDYKLLILTSTFFHTCKELVDYIDHLLKMENTLNKWVYVTGGKIITKEREIPANSEEGKKILFRNPDKNLDKMVDSLFYPTLIEKFLEYSPKYGISPFFVGFLEIMKASSGKNYLENFFKEKMREFEIMQYYYKQCFP